MFFGHDVGFQCARVSAQQKHDEISEIDRKQLGMFTFRFAEWGGIVFLVVIHVYHMHTHICMYVYVCICMYIYIYIYTYIHIHTYTYIYIYITFADGGYYFVSRYSLCMISVLIIFHL